MIAKIMENGSCDTNQGEWDRNRRRFRNWKSFSFEKVDGDTYGGVKIVVMKFIKIIHSFLAILPFAWFICFLIILFVGIFHFGYVPIEGNPVDPYKLGLDWLSIILTIISLGAYIAFYLWIAMSIVFIIFFKSQKFLNRTTTILFIVGVSGFFIFKYLFPGVFGWVLD